MRHFLEKSRKRTEGRRRSSVHSFTLTFLHCFDMSFIYLCSLIICRFFSTADGIFFRGSDFRKLDNMRKMRQNETLFREHSQIGKGPFCGMLSDIITFKSLLVNILCLVNRLHTRAHLWLFARSAIRYLH